MTIAWYLALPAITDPDAKFNPWLDPHQWEDGQGWTDWQNKRCMVVLATDEREARAYAAMHDCDIWLDALYAICVPVEIMEPGVVVAEGGGAENE